MNAGRLLARITVAPALLVAAWLVVALPLLMGGVFRPGPAILLWVPVAAAALWLGLRRRPRDETAERDGPLGPAPWWSVAGVIAVAVAFLVFEALMCSEQIIVRRDPASYVQFATWLKDHGSLPIPQMRWAFGGGDPALSFDSPAFYEHGGSVVPQFMAGLPLLLALGGWAGGVHGMLLMAPLLGACSVLAFGGLVARLVGPRWAPAGALLLALTLPMLWVSRSTFSEPPALILLLGGLSLLHDGRTERPRPAMVKAFLGGLALGLIVLVRIDGIRDILPAVVYAGLLVAWRRRTGYALAGGLALGAAAGLVEGYLKSRPYLNYLHASLNPLLVISGAIVVATVLMVLLLRWDATGRRLRAAGAAIGRGRLPGAAAVLTALVMAGFAVRPLVQTVRRVPTNTDDRLNAQFIEAVQKIDHLPLDGTRQYSELSLYWVVWYIGIPALLLATFGAALIVRRLMRRQSQQWLLPYAIVVWTTVQVLIRPGITPDHPWASRRLIGLVIPGLLLFTVFAAAWSTKRLRRLGYSRRVVQVTAVSGVVLMLVPIVITSAPYMVGRTDQKEVGAVDALCDRLGTGRSVVVVEAGTADRFLQVLRGMCGVPSARSTSFATQSDVRRVLRKIDQVGRHPVVMGSKPEQVAPYGRPRQIMALRSRQDGRTLEEPPGGSWGLAFDVWIAEPSAP
ncbi:hypothetical protein [Actinomadura verrucosospora]|uniref:Glycosyltransferase RgtA/B/C/D-like domain-containing protein n=1 Tax=Actinomadura verrucosospora TaxID=46165 RepID=A0A7D3VXK6_ACTVE|nr:hypothetical protein [Actinomadura verrucosospora]QKG25118.1 hypothetical protein ACTIVE_6769 [Actinomadura verrucosospora]